RSEKLLQAFLARVTANVRGLSTEPRLPDDGVEARKHLLERLSHVGDLELEIGTLLHDLHRALGIIDARQLNNDLTVAALLHDGLGHTELVDARADDLDRAVERLLSIRHHTLGLVNLERQVHSALQVESSLDRDSRDGVENVAVTALHSLDHFA